MSNRETKDSDKNFSEFILKDSNFSNLYPINYALTGSSAYGLPTNSTKEYVGIHLMNTSDYLQHPDFKTELDTIRLCYDSNYNLVSENSKNKSFSVTSFEMWKFISLYLKGSIVAYDILYLSSVFNSPEMIDVLNKLRQGINNRIGMSAKTYALNNWKKDRTDQRKITMSFYRILQAITFLRKEEYVSDITDLWNDSKFNKFVYGKKVFLKYQNYDFKKNRLLEKPRLSEKEVTGTSRELEELIDEINKASIATRLPDFTSKDILTDIFKSIIKKRVDLIYQN